MSRRPEPRFDWFIPIDGDGAHIGTRRAERPPTFEYLRRVDKRYEQAEEFIAALRALWAKPEPVVFEGSTIRLKGAVVRPRERSCSRPGRPTPTWRGSRRW